MVVGDAGGRFLPPVVPVQTKRRDAWSRRVQGRDFLGDLHPADHVRHPVIDVELRASSGHDHRCEGG